MLGPRKARADPRVFRGPSTVIERDRKVDLSSSRDRWVDYTHYSHYTHYAHHTDYTHYSHYTHYAHYTHYS